MVNGQPLQEGQRAYCDRCARAMVLGCGEWRHVEYAKRGEVCLHPSKAMSLREGERKLPGSAQR